MASVTVNLTGYDDNQFRIRWNDDIDLGATFAADGVGQTFNQIELYDGTIEPGRVVISINTTNDRFTPAFEASGRIIIEASDGETLEVMIANADMTEPYEWVPTNSAEVVAFAMHVRGLSDHDATLTLTDDPPTPPVPTATQVVTGGQTYTTESDANGVVIVMLSGIGNNQSFVLTIPNGFVDIYPQC